MKSLNLAHCLIIANLFVFLWFQVGMVFHICGNWFMYTGIASWPVIVVTLVYLSFRAWEAERQGKGEK